MICVFNLTCPFTFTYLYILLLAMPVLFILSGPKIGFSPNRATRCPDKREIWHGPLPVENFTFIGAEIWKYSPQNCQNFEFWP